MHHKSKWGLITSSALGVISGYEDDNNESNNNPHKLPPIDIRHLDRISDNRFRVTQAKLFGDTTPRTYFPQHPETDIAPYSLLPHLPDKDGAMESLQ